MASADTGQRFAPVTSDDHAGSIWIATLLCLVYTVITLVTRGFLRKQMYGVDDYLILGASFLHLGEALAIIIGLKNGLGHTLSLLRAERLSRASQAAFAGQLLFIASAWLAKCSTIWLMMRLFNLNGPKSQKNGKSKLYYMICLGLMAVISVWAIGSMIGLGADCSVSDYIKTPSLSKCPDQYVRWQVIAGIDIATEVILIMMSVVIVAPVHLSLYLKFQVVLAFLCRLPLVALAALRLHYVHKYRQSTNAGLAQEPILVLQQVYLCWSIISATIPNLKSFVRSFGSGFGIGIDMERYTNAYGTKGSYGNFSKHSYGKRFEMGSMKNTNNSSRNNTRLDNNGSFNDENHDIIAHMPQNTTQNPHHQESESIDSVGSQERIIRKQTDWRIHYENENDHTRNRA